MHPVYEGVKYYSPYDLNFSGNYEAAKAILDSFSESKQYEEINEILELYNAFQIATSSRIKAEYIVPYKSKEKPVMKTISSFFRAIDDGSLADQFKKVGISYIDDFWALFCKFKLYQNISSIAFEKLLNEPETTLYRILEHKEIVKNYDSVIADFMRYSDQTARIIVGKFLERKHSNSKPVYLPESLKTDEYESILERYIDSEYSNVGVIQLIAASQSSAECPLSDGLKLKAKKTAQDYWEKNAKTGISFSYGLGVCFKSLPEIKSFTEIRPHEYEVSYDVNWFKDNLDYPTLLNNFIYLFEYVDLCNRCSFTSVKSKLGIFERIMGVKGKKEYETGTVSRLMDLKASAEMNAYVSFLYSLNIRLEDIFSWFFEEYLKMEFGVEGFVMNSPSEGSTFLEKCRTLSSELDGVFKQYKMFVTNHVIDRELLEISSNPVAFSDLPSQLSNKYAYVNSDELEKEQFLLFSDQSMLQYVEKYKNDSRSFCDLLLKHTVTIDDYPEWEKQDIEWLRSRGTIILDNDRTIHMNMRRVALLKDLYDHDVLCCSYYQDKDLIDQLISTTDLRYGNTLFSIPEQEYLNYILNKHEFSNGLDLRNRYIHSTNTLNEQQQQRDYFSLLKIMALTILKINEEFCLNSTL